jgi:hypothetical protein
MMLWLKGPLQAGDFLIEWCVGSNALHHLCIHALSSTAYYVAMAPNDMLAIQEWLMANEGMDIGHWINLEELQHC